MRRLLLLFSFVVSCHAPRPEEAKSAVPASPTPAPEAPVAPRANQSKQDQQVNLVAFVGRRLSLREVVEPIPDGSIRFDAKYHARYQVLEVVFGDYPDDEIEFTAYEHVGLGFDRFETVLLYVSRHGRELVQQKYQFQPVFRTKEGAWAGCGDPYAGEPAPERRTVRAAPVTFAPEVTFDTAGLAPSQIGTRFPSPYFLVRNGVALCRMGATTDGLFRVKREGVLKGRRVFQ